MTPRKAVKEYIRESMRKYREQKKAANEPKPEPESYHGEF
jgi:hypothetical protein